MHVEKACGIGSRSSPSRNYLNNFSLLLWSELRTAAANAPLLASAFQTRLGTFTKHSALELSKRTKHLHHHIHDLQDEIGRTVNYGLVAEEIRIAADENRARLIETLVAEVADRLIARFPLARVEVELCGHLYCAPRVRSTSAICNRALLSFISSSMPLIEGSAFWEKLNGEGWTTIVQFNNQ
jgi:hypothetical protein